jgi:serine/threonine protein kinase
MHKRAADFDLGEILGEGSYSTVFLATDKFPPHKQYALKVLDKKHIIKVCCVTRLTLAEC